MSAVESGMGADPAKAGPAGLFDALLGSSPAGFALVDRNARYVWVNDALAAIDRLVFLAEASTMLASSLDYRATLGRLASLAVPYVADWCAVDVVGEDGSLERLAVQHVDPAKVALAADLVERYPPQQDESNDIFRVLGTGQSELYPAISDELIRAAARDQEHYRLITELGMCSAMLVPLVARGRTLGVLTLVSAESGVSFGDHDLSFVEDLARRAAVAIDNARLFEAQAAAHRELEQAQGQLRFLAEASEILAGSLDYRATLSHVVELAVPRAADWAGVMMVEDDGCLHRLLTTHADPRMADVSALTDRYPIQLDAPDPIVEVVRQVSPRFFPRLPDEIVNAVTPDARSRAALTELVRSLIVVPLSARGHTLGAIVMVTGPGGRVYDESDFTFAQELARRAALAIDNARLYDQQASMAHTLQESLLPIALPCVPGLDIAAAYHPSRRGTEVGGDFYDVFPWGGSDRRAHVGVLGEAGLGGASPGGGWPSDSGRGESGGADGRRAGGLDTGGPPDADAAGSEQGSEQGWAFVVGDVCGKGVEAASLTALARYTLRAAALHTESPKEALAVLNQCILAHRDDARFCTVALVRAVLDGDGLAVTVGIAGHPQPLVVRTDGRAEAVECFGTLLGVYPSVEIGEVEIRLGKGDALVLYTDGVTDARTPLEFLGQEGLASLLGGCEQRGAAGIVACIERAVLGANNSGLTDDVAILVLRVP